MTVYYGINRITSIEQAVDLLPQIHWTLGRATELGNRIDSDIEYFITDIRSQPYYEEINDEDNI